MLKIGLTGGIGSGKTAVACIFSVLGIPVFNADQQAKQILQHDPELKASIQKTFGAETYVEGKLNRSFLAHIVFNDPFKLEQLNALVHPATIRAANEWMEQQTAPYVVKEAALLFEAGSARNLNYIVGVHAPQHLRINRVMQRDNISRDEVLLRMNRQISETIKMKLCDFVVNNNEQALIIPQVLALHNRFLQMANP